jgi:DNA polymerase III subunit epsilon
MDYQETQEAAALWATKVLAQNDAFILDTETTGLDNRAEVCQIAIITMQGQILLNSLVKPTRPISANATRIHSITNAIVADAPTIADLAGQLREILGGATVVVYNSAFDLRILEQSLYAVRAPFELPLFGAYTYECAMEAYAAWVGEWNHYYGNYRYQPLPGGDHTALGDCRATLGVLKRMAGQNETPSV